MDSKGAERKGVDDCACILYSYPYIQVTRRDREVIDFTRSHVKN